MILQARTEKALREVIIIAAGLSIQDPRERPLDQQQQADAAHRRFRHPDSDFLTLLNIWDTWHDEFENLSQAKLRRFCRDHFLSYTRMREWRDIHTQLMDVLRERDDFRLTSVFDALQPKTQNSKPKTWSQNQHSEPETPNAELTFGTPAYSAIHRSILAGLLGNIAHFDEESGLYKATHDRRVALFPGSVLFQKTEPQKRRSEANQHTTPKKAPKSPRWIMASEIIETSRIYARTCARLDPAWALNLGAHLVRVTHSEPFWNLDAGRVMVKQRTRLYGLELETRSVAYGKINPVHATEIFIREGLVGDTITFPLDFIAHNRHVRESVEAILTRTRDAGYLNLDEALYRFYAHHLLEPPTQNSEPKTQNPISSVPELIDLVRERRTTEPRFLFLSPDDLRDPDTLAHDTTAFPESLPLENRALPLNYTYKPGRPEDGVTLDISIREAEALTPAALDWAVPGHLEQKVEHYLRALPKDLRRAFVPLAETAKSLTTQVAQRDRLTGRRETLTKALAFQISERFRVAIDPTLWADKPLPDHLRVRVRVVDDRGREIVASRDLAEVQAALHTEKREASTAIARAEPDTWRRARGQHEKPPATSWNFGDLPERVLVTEQAGVPVHAFPALAVEKDGVALRLFKTPEEARARNLLGLSRLLELNLSRDLAWLERDLRSLRELGPLISTLAPLDQLQSDAFQSLRRWLTDPHRLQIPKVGTVLPNRPELDSRALTGATFTAALDSAKSDLRGIIPRLVDLLREILTLRQSLLVHSQPHPGLDRELAALVPPEFLRRTPYPQLQHFPRYLRAMKLRADRWRQNPVKDAERAAQLAPYVAAAAKLPAPAAESFRWLIEEFRVSLFAQELGTAEPVSATKLDRALAAASNGRPPTSPAEPPAAAPKPILSAAVPDKKTAPLKNLGALDKLFKR